MWNINFYNPLPDESEKNKKRKRYEGRMGREGIKSRRTCMAKCIRNLLLVPSAGAISLAELSQTRKEQDSPLTAFSSEGEFLNFLKYEYPNLQFVPRQPSEDYEDLGDPDPDLLFMAYLAVANMIEKFSTKPVNTTGEILDSTVESAEYVIEYQQPIDETPFCERENLECNDDAASYCKKIDRPGIPMHYLSTFPFQAEGRFHFDWHQQAFCKLGDNRFIIFDNNGTATYWNGALQSYAYEYGKKVRMGIVPYFGISRYRKPEYNNGLSKMLVQAINSLPNEDEIECVNINRRMDNLV